jgi:hypothetical protein
MPIVSGNFKGYSFREAISMPNSPQPYLIEHLIYKKGKTVLVGKPKMGKSWFSIKASYCVAGNMDFLGLKTNIGRVAYLEFDRRFLTNTIHQLASEEEREMIKDWYIWKLPALALNRDADLKEIDKIVAKTKPDLVVIDHKSACFAGSENDDEPNRKWVQGLDTLAEKYGIVLLVVAQCPKRWRGDIQDLPLGSRILTAWADTIISITKSGDNARKIEISSNYGELEPIHYDNNFNVVTGEYTEITKQDIAKDMLLERWEECVYPNITKIVSDIAAKIKVSYKTVWDAYREIKLEKQREKEKEKDTT